MEQGAWHSRRLVINGGGNGDDDDGDDGRVMRATALSSDYPCHESCSTAFVYPPPPPLANLRQVSVANTHTHTERVAHK